MYTIQVNKKITINTDPQRRCYDGSKQFWTGWVDIYSYKDRKAAEESMATFQEINPGRKYQIIQEVN